MAAFEYQALDSAGRTKKGVITADSPKSARRELRKLSLTPVKVSATREKSSSGSATVNRRKLSAKELVLVTRQLSMLIGSGTPVEQAIASVTTTAEKDRIRSILASVRANVVEGQSFSEALRSEPRSFPKLYSAIVSAGESAGALDAVLDRLANYLEASEKMRSKIISALIYPIILAIVALSVIVALLIFVVPRVVEQFDTMGQTLPFLTTAMVSISSFLQAHGLFLLGAVVALIILLNQLVKNQNIKRRVDKFILGLPIVGRVVRDVTAARFARTFATLANSGAPVLDCLSAARETTLNLVMRDAVDEMRDAVREGGSLNKAMSKTAAFPPLVVHMAASGEDGGRLGHMFDKGAEYLENEFEAASSVALGLLEPLITVIMGGLVLMIILAIMLPILQMNTAALG